MNDWQPIEAAPSGEDVIVFSPTHECQVWIAHKSEIAEGEIAWFPQDESTWGGAATF